jgi:putative spermidine/putrescine transport system ATP-binding protein
MDIEVTGVAKSYGTTLAVSDVSFGVEQGHVLSLLGPSGCGKTTVMRMIAGLISPSAGSIAIKGQPVTRIPVHRRNVGMLFQNYALFPHLDVSRNIAFGLEMRKVRKDEAARKVEQALAMVRLDGFGARYPHQLSGGQQQRVALARALVIEPAALLLDEPFGALDKKLRENMQIEMRQLQQRLGITTLMVTHDQDEALTLSDRIAVMRAGRIEQFGTPTEIYERPVSRFVANFIGTSNFFRGTAAIWSNARTA